MSVNPMTAVGRYACGNLQSAVSRYACGNLQSIVQRYSTITGPWRLDMTMIRLDQSTTTLDGQFAWDGVTDLLL